MKTRFFNGVLGMVISVSLLFTVPAFAHGSHDRGGHGDRDYRSGGHMDRDYSYHGYGDHAYRERPSYRYDSYSGYGHRSGAFGHWGKDARYQRRGHRRHHGF
ncbi:MAG: hypothetical protein AB7P69_16640 [Candidatus Binatia bacterium]